MIELLAAGEVGAAGAAGKTVVQITECSIRITKFTICNIIMPHSIKSSYMNSKHLESRLTEFRFLILGVNKNQYMWTELKLK
jgi:hypothetical protein